MNVAWSIGTVCVAISHSDASYFSLQIDVNELIHLAQAEWIKSYYPKGADASFVFQNYCLMFPDFLRLCNSPSSLLFRFYDRMRNRIRLFRNKLIKNGFPRLFENESWWSSSKKLTEQVRMTSTASIVLVVEYVDRIWIASCNVVLTKKTLPIW